MTTLAAPSTAATAAEPPFLRRWRWAPRRTSGVASRTRRCCRPSAASAAPPRGGVGLLMFELRERERVVDLRAEPSRLWLLPRRNP